MRPTFLGFETQKRTLSLAQKNLDITGNNISNTNTVGYTRQRVDMYAMYISGNRSLRWSSPTAGLSLTGQGSNAYGVSQIRDIYIDKRYRENVAIEAESEKNIEILSDIEDVLDNFESDGLQKYTQNFFDALQNYAGEKPDSSEVANIAKNNAMNLCRLLNAYDQELCGIEDTYVLELQDTVDYVNEMLGEMNYLNERIDREKFNYNEEYGPNELYDDMNLYIDELSTYGDIEVSRNSNGTYNIKMAGVEILNGEKLKSNDIVMKDYDKYGEAILLFQSGEELNVSRGIFRSYENMINGNGVYATGHQNGKYGIAYFKSALDAFASTIARVFNGANGADDDKSRAMFEASNDGTVITAGNIRVTDAWDSDPTMIGKVRHKNEITGESEYGFNEQKNEVTGEVTLQNTNVNFLISQFDKKSIVFGNANDFCGTVDEYIGFVSDRLAENISYDNSRHETGKINVDLLLDSRDAISGVDMSEEGINMLNYQKWYSASARMVTTLDDCLDKLINGTGRVGL